MIKRISATFIVFILLLQFYTLQVFCEADTGKTSQTPVLKAETAVLMDQITGKALYEKDSHKRMYPASLTKVLTAILVMENLDMNDEITVGKEINLAGKDSSGAGLNVGDRISGRDLIWAIMLPSGNDASYTAAVTVARKKTGNVLTDTQDAVNYFTDLMNKRAREIGAKQSNFVNPDGYPDENHYSTAYDLALISREAMKNDFFREVARTYSYTVKDNKSSQVTLKSKKGSTEWFNKNQMINPHSKYYYKYAAGIKTGTTSAAGYCLASYAIKDDMALISIVLKANKEEARWVDSKALFEYGFGNFKYHTLMQKGESISKIKVVRKYLEDVLELNAVADQDYTDILTDKDFKEIKQVIEWDPALVLPAKNKNNEIRLSGPIKSGQVVGKVSYISNGNILSESRLLADKDSKKGDFTDTIYIMLDQGFSHKYIIILLCIALIIGTALIIGRRVLKRRRKEQ